jgi:hypothetical protein
VCQCYARKIFLEISYLGCCNTSLKKFQNDDEYHKSAGDGDIEDELVTEANPFHKDNIDNLLKEAEDKKQQARRINILESTIPEQLLSLYQGSGSDGKFFITHANSLNQALAFCSLGADFNRWDGSKFVRSICNNKRF